MSTIQQKETELEERRARNRPWAIVVLVVSLYNVITALAGSSIGPPFGYSMISIPLMLVLVVARVPSILRQSALQKEIAALRSGK